jgi:hypothetical protein
MTATLGPLARLQQRLRVEDVLLFLWLVFRPLLVPAPARDIAQAGYDPIGGLFDLVALCLAAACLVSRRADSTHTGLIRNQDVAYAVGPLFGAVAFALDDAGTRLGLTDGAQGIALVAPVVAGAAARLWLPPTTALHRRALVTPFLLATSGFFSDFLSGLSRVFDLRFLGTGFSSGELVSPFFVFVIGLLAVGVFYLMLVFAPRQIADREGTGQTWALRFVVFVIGLTVGTTLAAMVRGG